MSKKQGRVGRPGIVLIVPTNGYIKPAPILALISWIGSINPVGAPFWDGMCENEYCVFAIQIGRPENPCLVYISICFSAFHSQLKKYKLYHYSLLNFIFYQGSGVFLKKMTNLIRVFYTNCTIRFSN